MTAHKVVVCVFSLGALGCQADVGESGGGPSVNPEPEPEVVLGQAEQFLLGTMTRSFVHRGGRNNTQAEIDERAANPDPIFGTLDDDGAHARGGHLNIGFYAPESLPVDSRERVDIGSQEFCTFEMFPSDYPTVTPAGQWPRSRSPMPSGDIIIKVDEAPGDIVYQSDDEGFYFREAPAAIQLGSFTHRDFFEPDYLPFGETLTVDVSAGPEIGNTSYTTQTAEEFTTQRPNMVTGDTLIDVNQDQTFTWTAGDGSSRMQIAITDGGGLVRCDVRDDGEAVVPKEMMNRFAGGEFSSLSITMRRELRTVSQVEDSNGQIIDVRFTSAYTEFGRFPNLEDSRL